jgi:hypothetical protein
VRDEDDGKILDECDALLWSETHLARMLCDQAQKLEVTLCYCERPQYITTPLGGEAAPAVGERMSRKLKLQRDFGIR